MKISQMKEVLGIAHKAQAPVHMIGEHGIGKTAIVKEFAEEMGYHCEVLQLTIMDTGDLIGMPVISEDSNGDKVTTWAKPIWLQRVHQANAEGNMLPFSLMSLVVPVLIFVKRLSRWFWRVNFKSIALENWTV
jgi:hypothetical protein